MRQRSLNPPQQAMLAYSGDPASIVAARSMTARAGRTGTRLSVVPARAAAGAAAARTGGCGCGGGKPASSCGCGGTAARAGCSCGSGGGACSCGGAGRHFPPARRDEDGKCANIFEISCETRWQIRECFKVAFCDLLRCVGDELCEAEEPELRECLEDFLCSFIKCLPDAICPPPECCEPCCPADDEPSCHCNFAVGD